MKTAEEVFDVTIRGFESEDRSLMQALAYSVLGAVECDRYMREASALLLTALIKFAIDRYEKQYWSVSTARTLAAMVSEGEDATHADLLFLQVWSGFYFDKEVRNWIYDPTKCQGGVFNASARLYRAWRALPSADRMRSSKIVESSLAALAAADGEALGERYAQELKDIESSPRFWELGD